MRVLSYHLPPTTYHLVSKPAHPHVENQAEARERGDHRRPSVTQQRKRQTFDRRKAGRHRYVVNHLEREAGHHSHHEIDAEPIFGQARRLERAPDHDQIQAEHEKHADKTLFFSKRREDEIVVGDRQEPELPLCAPHVAFALPPTRPNGDLRLDLLVARALRILRGIEERLDAAFLIWLEREIPRDG